MDGRTEAERRPLVPWWPARHSADQSLTRIPPRGPARLALLLLGTLGWVSLAGSMMLAGIGQPPALLALIGAVLATTLMGVMRAWTLGTYVDDEGFVIRRFMTTRRGRWSAVEAVDVGRARVVLQSQDAAGGVTSIRTHVCRWSIDLVGSRDGYQTAADQLCRWQARQ